MNKWGRCCCTKAGRCTSKAGKGIKKKKVNFPPPKKKKKEEEIKVSFQC